MNISRLIWKKVFPGLLILGLALLSGQALGQEGADKDSRPDSVQASAQEDQFGVSREAMEQARSNILGAENSKLNKRVTLNLDVFLRYGLYGLPTFPAVLGGGSSPNHNMYDVMDFQTAINFGYNVKGGTLSASLNYQSQLDNFSQFVKGIGIGNATYSSSLFGTSYKLSAGFGTLGYEISGSPIDRPLLAGTLKGQDIGQTVWLFERVPWLEVKDPGPVYSTTFKDMNELVLPEGYEPISVNGISLAFKLPFEINCITVAMLNAFNPLVGINRKFGPITIGGGYQRVVTDPDQSYHPVYVSEKYNANLVGNFSFVTISLDAGYTGDLIHEYIITNHKLVSADRPPEQLYNSGLSSIRKYGKAGLVTLLTKKKDFLFFGQNQLLLRGFYADRGFDPTANAINDINFLYPDVINPVDSLHDINQLYYGSTALYGSDRFDFLSGKIRIMAGAMKMAVKTPDVYRLTYFLNSKVWHYTGNIYGGDYFGPLTTDHPTDYKSIWQQDWTAEYEGSSQVAWSYYQYKDYTRTNAGAGVIGSNSYRVKALSKKNFSMLTVDYSWNLSDLFDFPVPVYLMGRWQSSAIFVGTALSLPFKKNANKEIDYYAWFHYFAIPIKPNFVLNGYFGVERNQHLQPDRAPAVDPDAFKYRKLAPNQILVARVNNGLFFLPIDEQDIGYGFGFDWYFKEGLGFYVRTHFASQKDAIQNFSMKGYGIRFELRKFFTYS